MKQKTFVDIDPNFIANPVTGDIATLSDVKAIMFAVKNLVMTDYYERLFHSEIGSPVHSLLFGMMDSFQFSIILKRAIFDVLNIYEPRVTIEGVEILDSADNNRVYVKIHVSIKTTNIPLTVNLTLERTR